MRSQYEPSICESCGEGFGCGAKLDGCWCNEITLPAQASDELRQQFGKCLCPNCLAKYSAAPAIKITYPDGSIELVAEAVRVDMQNFHEGMFDFYDERGNLLRQIGMDSGIKWEAVEANKEAL